MKLENIDTKTIDKYLPLVIALHKKNTHLGHFPYSAFEDYARKGNILVGIDESNNELVGYVLYYVSNRWIKIVHFCINVKYRSKGYSKEFIEAMKSLSIGYDGIKLNCRRDYDADKIWPKLGFLPIFEKNGRSKAGSRLTCWCIQNIREDLLSASRKKAVEDKTSVVIDANIYFNLINPKTDNSESASLEEDWLREEIELCVTPEIFSEINRHSDSNEREKALKAIGKYARLDEIFIDNKNRREEIINELRKVISSKSPSSQSDVNHLAYAILWNISYFITLDNDLIKVSKSISNSFDIEILRPTDLIIKIDKIQNEDKYLPARLAGSTISYHKISESIAKEICSSQLLLKQKKHEFQRRLNIYLSKPNIFDCNAIKNTNNNLIVGFIVLDRTNNSYINIPLIRFNDDYISNLVLESVILNLTKEIEKEEHNYIRISDNMLSGNIKHMLQKHLFVEIDGHWIRLSIPLVIKDFSQIMKNIKIMAKMNIIDKNILNKYSALINDYKQCKNNLKIEQLLWPLKIRATNIPCFIVPIKPYWAAQLFDEIISCEDLFASKCETALSNTKVYYRSAFPKILEAPARVLWYVSNNKNSRLGKQIRACSYIEEVSIDKPKNLFKKYKKIGIYEWQDVFKVAKRDVKNNVMSFLFSYTELFSTPVPWSQIMNIVGRKAPIQTPVRITKEKYYEIYMLAKRGKQNGKSTSINKARIC